MIVEFLLYSLVFFFITGVLSPFFIRNNKLINYIAHGMAALGSLAAVLCAIIVFSTGKLQILTSLVMFGEAVYVRVDYLAAYFLLTVGIVGCIVSVYAIGYSREYLGDTCRYRVMAALYNAFLLSMILVVCVSHIVAFIIVWEIMALTSFLLVNYEHEKLETSRAAFIYIVMTHVGTAFIITAFFLLANKAGGLAFLRLIEAAGSLDVWTKNAVFLCALIGFGAKAGIVPLHIWLPRAHPAAPSHVSALMSGVMLKTAIYGLCRFYLDFLGTSFAWWGALVLVLAVVTAVLGVLYALMEHDVKRLLAYSSVENIGIILLGMGAGLLFSAKGNGTLAALAWAAALYHVLNHAIFKSLLFMGAGAILQAAHTKDMEHLGGLIKRMPYTAVWFLAGAAAISALPPFNGFVSEWLTFQALFYLPQSLAGVTGKLFSAFLLAMLGLTGALAAACFIKAFGIIFLAKPRSSKAAEAEEANKPMLVSMALLASLCLVLGIWPEYLLQIISKVLTGINGINAGLAFAGTTWQAAEVHAGTTGGSLQMPVVAALFLVGAIVAWGLFRVYGREQVHKGETWTCGIVPTARMEYTAIGFSKPIRLAFKSILRPQHETVVDLSPNRYFGRRLSYHVSIVDIFSATYRPINAGIIRIAQLMKPIQAGSVQLYIGYITAITVVALILSTWW
ncbi:MAG: dehydrogenase (quinone) [Firmicutes bacterium]|nr:dehydrogenase (quinone) [Bacillota bacterium]